MMVFWLIAAALAAVALVFVLRPLAGRGKAPRLSRSDANLSIYKDQLPEPDADGWKLLGRSYTVMGRFQEAVDAYAKAAQRDPRDAQLLADFADALAMARGPSGQMRLFGEPERLIERALEIDPKNLKALALA